MTPKRDPNVTTRTCMACGAQFLGNRTRSYCTRRCAGSAAHKRPDKNDIDQGPSGAEVERRLAADVARECAMPWEKHPQPWTDVSGRPGHG